MKNFLLTFPTALLFTVTCAFCSAQTVSGTAPKTRFHDTIISEFKYDPAIRTQAEAQKTEPAENAPQQPETSPKEPEKTFPEPDVIMEKFTVTAKRVRDIQIQIAELDELIARKEKLTQPSTLDTVINNPKINLPFMGGMSYDVRVAMAKSAIAQLQYRRSLLVLMQASTTYEEYQRYYRMWFYHRYGKMLPEPPPKNTPADSASKSTLNGAGN